MPGGRTKFQAKWLENRDKNSDLISNWCHRGKTEYEAYCVVCNCYFSISNSGISQVRQHSLKKKHISATRSLKCQKTLTGTPVNASSSTNNSEQTTPQQSLALQLTKDQMTIRAEALWVMKICVSNFSFASNQNIVDLFQRMFEGHPVALNMKLSDRKISYTISHGLGPYFQNEIAKELKESINKEVLYTLSFDETTTSQMKKQLDLYVRFWSSKSDCIVSAYLTSLFLGHATADIIFNSIMDSLNDHKLPLNKIVMIAMDGPSVNKAVLKKLNEELIKSKSPELLDIGSCCLHKVHNSFLKALNSLPLDVDQFAIDLFSFFKCSPARREDLQDLQKLLDCEEKFLLRHVNSRWITLGPVVRRILTIYPSLEEYFLKFLPQQNDGSQNSRLERIVSNLKNPLTVAYLEFVSSIATVLEGFLTLFQMEGPLIHLLHNKTNELLRSIMTKFLKESCVELLEGHKLIEIDIEKEENIRPLNDIDIGIATRKALSEVKESSRKTARLAMRKSLIELYKYLKNTLPVSNKILKDLEQLHPLMRPHTTDIAIQRLCLNMQTLQLNEQAIDLVVAEWKIYRLDPDLDAVCENFRKQNGGTDEISFQPIDKFWSQVFKICDRFTGKPKYWNLSKVVKPCLSLAHGNADVERGFSINNSLVCPDRSSLGESTIIGVRSVKDAVRRYGNILDVPITTKFLESVANAHSAYAEEKRKENEERQQKEKIKRKQELELHKANLAKKKKIDSKEKLTKVDKYIESLQEELTAAQSILKEGNERLHAAVKKKDYKEINIATAMIDAGTQKIGLINEKLAKAHKDRKKIQI